MTSLQTYLSECKKRLESNEHDKQLVKAWNKRVPTELFVPSKDFIARCPSDLARLIEIVECLREGLDDIRKENECYAETAFMDWDGVQSTALQALRKADQLAKVDKNEV